MFKGVKYTHTEDGQIVFGVTRSPYLSTDDIVNFAFMSYRVELTFLGSGTSQGVPVIACDCDVCASANQFDKRTRSSVMFRVGGKNLVVDTGPDFRQQMLREEVKQLDGLLFTHDHKDHVAGMDDVRAFNFTQKKPMPIWCNAQVESSLKREYPYVFETENRYPGVPSVNLNLIDGESFLADGIDVTPIKAWHGKSQVLGFRIGDVTYITDANRIDAEEKEKIRGSRILVLNALRKTAHHSHFTLDEAIELSRELGTPETYFTHISHLMGRHEDVQAELPDGMFLAYDGLKVSA